MFLLITINIYQKYEVNIIIINIISRFILLYESINKEIININIVYLIITFAFFAICKIEEPNQDIIISITKRPLQIPLNYNSMFSLETDFLDKENIFDISDIQEKTNFDSFLSERNSNKYNISCHLWKPKDANLRIFCTLKEKIPKEINFLKMEEISSFIYKDSNIQIKPSVSLEVYVSETEEPNIAFLYSDKQVIKIEDKIESYELKYMIAKKIKMN